MGDATMEFHKFFSNEILQRGQLRKLLDINSWSPTKLKFILNMRAAVLCTSCLMSKGSLIGYFMNLGSISWRTHFDKNSMEPFFSTSSSSCWSPPSYSDNSRLSLILVNFAKVYEETESSSSIIVTIVFPLEIERTSVEKWLVSW